MIQQQVVELSQTSTRVSMTRSKQGTCLFFKSSKNINAVDFSQRLYLGVRVTNRYKEISGCRIREGRGVSY